MSKLVEVITVQAKMGNTYTTIKFDGPDSHKAACAYADRLERQGWKVFPFGLELVPAIA